MRIGTQIAHVPMHAHGDIKHPDVEFGFITGISNDIRTVFCRYWLKNHPGKLRTVSCSEPTDVDDIVEYKSVPQETITKLLDELYGEHYGK